MRKRRLFVAGAVLAVLLGVAWTAYPLYPTRMSLCDLATAREKEPDRWASPQRGAVVALTADLYGTHDEVYGLRTRCQGHDMYVALLTRPSTIASPSTRRALRDLRNPQCCEIQRHATFAVLARVDSEVQSCFGPGMVLSALALQSRSDVRVEKSRM